MTPPFDRVYSGNPLMVRLFAEVGIPVESPTMYERETYCGTAIRKLMLDGESWEHRVPPAVASVIREIGGVERLQQIAGSD